jgi:hypothetical protein
MTGLLLAVALLTTLTPLRRVLGGEPLLSPRSAWAGPTRGSREPPARALNVLLTE